MKYILLNIEHLLSKANKILIANSNWQEVINYNYELSAEATLEYMSQEPNNHLDEDERSDILKFFAEYDFSYINTRQCVFQPKYKEDNSKAACISCLQVIIRNGRIDLHVFVRSQNVDSNFIYDNCTYAMIVQSLSKTLNLSIGKIYVKIVSLHRILKIY